jgi:hypothetical protein
MESDCEHLASTVVEGIYSVPSFESSSARSSRVACHTRTHTHTHASPLLENERVKAAYDAPTFPRSRESQVSHLDVGERRSRHFLLIVFWIGRKAFCSVGKEEILRYSASVLYSPDVVRSLGEPRCRTRRDESRLLCFSLAFSWKKCRAAALLACG